MNKILATAFVFAALFPSLAYAKADVSLSASRQSLNAGQTFTVTVGIMPSPETAYTSKIALSYSSDILEATSFAFAPTWLTLSQPGYDTMDTANGIIVKTAGYPGGASAPTTFGTITFRAKQAGNATIQVSQNTMIYDRNNANVFSGAQTALQIAVAPAQVAPAPTPAPVKAAPALTTKTVTAPIAASSSASDVTANAPTSTQVAAAAATGSSSHALLWIVILIIAGGIGYIAWNKMKAKPSKRR